MSKPESPSHFQGKEAIDHVVEAQTQGIIASSEIHGTELPGNLSAGSDAARETAIILLLLWISLSTLSLFHSEKVTLSLIFLCGWVFWKTGRSAWLGWFRLERLHRIVAQERFEIEHHRLQERDELRVLYATKGFEGKLLEDVLDVLMADNDRLLKVMVEEELGLTLMTYQHPLKQSLGALIGVVLSSMIFLFMTYLHDSEGAFVGSAITMALASAFTAYLSQNKIIPAMIWNIGIGALASGTTYFLLQIFKENSPS